MEHLSPAARLRAVLVLVLWLVPAWASTAQTGTRARISVLLAPQDVFSRGATEWTAHLVLERLRSESLLEVVEPEELFQSESLARARQVLEEASRLVEDGFSAYQDLELDKALASLAEAQKRLPEAVPALGKDGPRFVEKLLSLLGSLYLLRGEQQPGQQIFRQLLTVVPGARLDDRLFPPRLVGIFQTVARDVEQGDRGELELVSVPSNSRAYIDFRFSCVTPCSVPALSVGSHLVVARKCGFESATQQVQVEAGKNRLQLHLPDLPDGENLERLVDQAVSGAGSGNLPEGLSPLLERAGLDQVVLGILGRSGANFIVRLVLLEAKSGKMLAATHTAITSPTDQSAGQLQKAVSDLLKGRVDVLEWAGRYGGTTGPLAGEDRFGLDAVPLWRKWWFWTTIGAGAAAVALAVVLGVLLTRPGEPSGVFVLEF